MSFDKSSISQMECIFIFIVYVLHTSIIFWYRFLSNNAESQQVFHKHSAEVHTGTETLLYACMKLAATTKKIRRCVTRDGTSSTFNKAEKKVGIVISRCLVTPRREHMEHDKRTTPKRVLPHVHMAAPYDLGCNLL